jgi:hypothetical protein
MAFFDFLKFKNNSDLKQKIVLIRSDSEWESNGFDPLFEKVARFIIAHKSCSTSFLQRNFRIGYARTRKIIQQLEQARIIECQTKWEHKILLNDQNSLNQLIEGLNKFQVVCMHPEEETILFQNKKYFHEFIFENPINSLYQKNLEEDFDFDDGVCISFCRACKRAISVVHADLTDEQKVWANQIETVEANDACYVYLMKDFNTGYHKIGISNSPEYREKTLQSEKPTIEMICNKRYISRKIAHSFEQALHETFSDKRVRGEWFDLNQKNVQEIEFTLNS